MPGDNLGRAKRAAFFVYAKVEKSCVFIELGVLFSPEDDCNRRESEPMQPTADHPALITDLDLDAWVMKQTSVLTLQELGLLQFLAGRRDTVVTKTMIMDHLYPSDTKALPKVVDVLICKIRTKTGDNSVIEAVWGRGYIIRTPGFVRTLSQPTPDGAHRWKMRDLPDPMTPGGIRWVASRKKAVVEAWITYSVDANDLRLLYDMTLEELERWEQAFREHGEDGLKQLR